MHGTGRTLRNAGQPAQLLLLIATIAAVYFVVAYFFPKHENIGDTTNYTPFLSQHSIQTEINGSAFWDKKANYHGLRPNVLPTYYDSSETCSNFFASWPGDCVGKEAELHDRLRVFSAQMTVMNATLTLYVTSMKSCDFNYPNILVRVFDKMEILKAYGFEDAFPKIDHWVKTRYTRISDILRIALAHRFQQSYVDTDVHFLDLNKNLYEVPYVGVGVYSDLKNSLEISNAAFCLPQEVLRDMLTYQHSRIVKGSDNYFYTELGPSMFHKVRLISVLATC
jgi:hypothetical protein